MLKTSEPQSGPSSCCFMQLFHANTVWSQVTQVTVYEQTSGPANCSQHNHRESEKSVLSEWKIIKKAEGRCSNLHSQRNLFFFLYPSPNLLHHPGYPRSGRIVVLVKPNLTSDQALAACRVTSTESLSLPLCSHLVSLFPELYFPTYKVLALLASSCHAQKRFP